MSLVVGLAGRTWESITSTSLLIDADGPLRTEVVSSSIIFRCSVLAILASLVFRRLGIGVKQNFDGTASCFSVRLVGPNPGKTAATKSSSQKCSLQTRAFLS